VILLVVGSYYIAWPGFREWRQNRSLVEAEGYEQTGDHRRALLILEQTVQLYPFNWEARRRLANFLERAGQRQGLEAWKEIVRSNPGETKNLLGLAGAALRFGEPATARQALAQVPRADRATIEYCRLAAGVAVVTQDGAALEAALAEWSRLQPADLRVQLNLAIARLQSPDPARAEAGRAALITLARSEPVRLRAVVEILNDMGRRWPRPSAERAAAFQQVARILTPAQGPSLEPPELSDPVERLVTLAMHQPDPPPEDVGAFLSWLILNGRAAAGFAWRETLPAGTRDSPLVIVAASEAALRTADWTHLRQLLLAGAWGRVPAPVVEGAFAVRELRRPTPPGPESARWAEVIESGESSLPALKMLLRLSEAWQWPEGKRQVLTAITRTFAGEPWAWRQLISIALAQGDSEQLWQIYQRWSRAVPGDTTVQIETAIMGLLLEKRGAPTAAITAGYVRLRPADPGAVVAHALALWRERQLAEAVPLLAALAPEVFTETRYALAYGLILSAAGQARESEPMLTRASAERLLPDEMLLVEQARARNRLRLSSPSRSQG
jgi:tetratricopeptide (TPR) repeat protein